MQVKVNNKIYEVQPLELISNEKIDINSLDYHKWLADVVIELINEFYLKDAKALHVNKVVFQIKFSAKQKDLLQEIFY